MIPYFSDTHSYKIRPLLKLIHKTSHIRLTQLEVTALGYELRVLWSWVKHVLLYYFRELHYPCWDINSYHSICDTSEPKDIS